MQGGVTGVMGRRGLARPDETQRERSRSGGHGCVTSACVVQRWVAISFFYCWGSTRVTSRHLAAMPSSTPNRGRMPSLPFPRRPLSPLPGPPTPLLPLPLQQLRHNIVANHLLPRAHQRPPRRLDSQAAISDPRGERPARSLPAAAAARRPPQRPPHPRAPRAPLPPAQRCPPHHPHNPHHPNHPHHPNPVRAKCHGEGSRSRRTGVPGTPLGGDAPCGPQKRLRRQVHRRERDGEPPPRRRRPRPPPPPRRCGGRPVGPSTG